MSRHLAANAAARAAYRGSSRSRCPYSFRVDPQPAALITIASTPASAGSNASMKRRASASASVSRPECIISAPQQPCAWGITTSQPSAASTRAVAALTSLKKTRCTQPSSRATRRRRAPRAGTTAGIEDQMPSNVIGGATASMARSRAGSRRNSPLARSSRWIPRRW